MTRPGGGGGENASGDYNSNGFDHLFAPTEGTSPAPPNAHEQVPSAGESGSSDDQRPRWGRRIVVTGALLFGVAYLAGYYFSGQRMPANTTISGVSVSGQSPDKARETLRAELGPLTKDDIVITGGKNEFDVDPNAAGLSLNVDESVAKAGGARTWDPRKMLNLVTGSRSYDAVVDAEPKKLASVLASLAESIDKPAVQPQITFPDGKPQARQPRDGKVVDKAATTDVIKRLYVTDDDAAPVVTKTVRPDVSADELDEAMRTIAKTAVSGPVELRVGAKRIDLPVTGFAPALQIRVQDGELKPYLDPKKLARPLTGATTGIGRKAVDATVVFTGGRPTVRPSRSGIGLRPKEMSVKLLPVLGATGRDRSLKIEAKSVKPDFTTAQAKKLRIKEKISEFTTEYPPATYRDINQGLAARRINGTVIKPGETFSMNTIVGERTASAGYVPGSVINGGVFRDELGGGVSQVATTMYNAAFFGAMDDVEHHPHAFYIDRYPVGREATVYWGNLDLRWRNSTDYGVLVRAWVDKSGSGRNGRMNVELWSTKIYDVKAGLSAKRNFRAPGTRYDDSPSCAGQAPIAGFDIDVYRTIYRNGKKVKSETNTAVYQAADRVICGKKPK